MEVVLLSEPHIHALWACAETCLSQQPPNILQAIRCLMAAADNASGAVDVTVTIQTRLKLAQLLISHTQEIDMATDNLQKVVRLVAPPHDDSLSNLTAFFIFSYFLRIHFCSALLCWRSSST